MSDTPANPPALSDLLKRQLTTLIRKIVLIGVTLAVAHHVNAATANAVASLFDPSAIAEELFGLGTVIWSLWENKNHNTKMLMAAATGATTATPTKSDTIMLMKAGVDPASIQTTSSQR